MPDETLIVGLITGEVLTQESINFEVAEGLSDLNNLSLNWNVYDSIESKDHISRSNGSNVIVPSEIDSFHRGVLPLTTFKRGSLYIISSQLHHNFTPLLVNPC